MCGNNRGGQHVLLHVLLQRNVCWKSKATQSHFSGSNNKEAITIHRKSSRELYCSVTLEATIYQTYPLQEHRIHHRAVFPERSRPANRRRCWVFSQAGSGCWSQSRLALRRPVSQRTPRFLASDPCARHVADGSRRWRGQFGRSNTWPPNGGKKKEALKWMIFSVTIMLIWINDLYSLFFVCKKS